MHEERKRDLQRYPDYLFCVNCGVQWTRYTKCLVPVGTEAYRASGISRAGLLLAAC